MLSHPNSQRFLPDRSEWVDAGEVPADLVPSAGLEEVGPALLLYDGRVLEFGATGHTDFYAVNERGGSSWTAGPDLPHTAEGIPQGSADGPACLLPNGRALVAVGPLQAGWTGPPTTFYEFWEGRWIPASDPPLPRVITPTRRHCFFSRQDRPSTQTDRRTCGSTRLIPPTESQQTSGGP